MQKQSGEKTEAKLKKRAVMVEDWGASGTGGGVDGQLWRQGC